MKVLSLFDGISCGMVALQRAGIKVENVLQVLIKKTQLKKKITLKEENGLEW